MRASVQLAALLLTFLAAPQLAAQTTAEAAQIVAPAPLGSHEVAYPQGARGDAEVILELVIAEDGSVATAAVRDGQAPFAEAARVAAQSFRFTPATRGGLPIRARIAMRVLFREPPPPEPAPTPATDGAAQPSDATSAAPATGDATSAIPLAAAPAVPEPIEIQVLGEPPRDLGSIPISREEARRVPGAFGDPFRVVEVLPGVAPLLSGLPYFYVRGAPPGSVGYTIDGIRVPLLFHVGSGPSVIAPALVDRVDLFSGPYPARLGRYSGAVLAGETMDPSERPRLEAQARVFDASAMAEQPFDGGRGSVLLGGRYSYTQAILSAVAPDYELGYWDYQARLSYAVTPSDRLTAFAFGGFDRLHNRERGLTLFDVGFHRVDLRWDRAHEDGRMRVAATYSEDRVLAAPEDDGAPGSAQRSRGVRVRSEFEQRVAGRSRLRGGADVGAERVEDEREQVGDRFVAYPDRTDWTTGAWLDLAWRPSRVVEVVPGARFDFMRSRGEDHVFVDPRLAARVRLADGVAYLSGLGMAHQVPTYAIRMPGRRPNVIERSVQESVQASQGVEYALPLSMLGRTTLFHQFVDVDLATVHGRSYGVEQFLRRDFTEKLGGFLSYTLSRAQATVGRETVLSSFDRTHVLSGVLGYELGAGYRLGLRGYFASGRSYTVDCPTPDCGPGDPSAPRPHLRRGRLPAFSRLDLRFEKRWRFDDGWWITAAFEWFNVLLSSEVEDAYWTPRGLVFDEQSPLTLPSLGIELGY